MNLQKYVNLVFHKDLAYHSLSFLLNIQYFISYLFFHTVGASLTIELDC